MTEVVFLDELPKLGRTDPAVVTFAIALRSKPGKWAQYPNQEFMSEEYRRALSSRITRQRKYNLRPPEPLRGEFESAVRGTLMYVRYTGKKK